MDRYTGRRVITVNLLKNCVYSVSHDKNVNTSELKASNFIGNNLSL